MHDKSRVQPNASADEVPGFLRFVSESSFLTPDHIVLSGWLEHAPFAFWLVQALAPRTFVELGSHSGYSYFTICQTVHKYDLRTACYAVDTWEGDEHASFYGEEIYRNFVSRNEKYKSFSTLLRMTFDKATAYFPDKSVDLLHVDGRHFYDDVKADFEAWRPKMSDDCVVMFHDTNVRVRDFGVWRFFDELKSNHPAFEFVHGNGLGIVAVGHVPPALKCFFEASEEDVASARLVYGQLGSGMSARWSARQAEECAREAKETHRRDRELASTTANRLRERADAAEAALQSVEAYRRRAGRSKDLLGIFLRSQPKAAQPGELEIVSKLQATGLFDAGYYRANNPEVVLSGMDPLLHFVREGCRRGRKPNEMFDPEFYRKQRPDLEDSTMNMLLHFVETGADDGLKPCPDFDPAFYLATYPDVVEAQMNPLLHYIAYGRMAGRKPRRDGE